MGVDSVGGQNVFRVEVIDKPCDHQGSFSTFIDCFQEELLRIKGQDKVIVCFDSMLMGKPHRDVYEYDPQVGIESLRADFEADYKDGINLDSGLQNSEQ